MSASPNSAKRGPPLAYSPLVVLTVALALGIALDRYWPQPAGTWWLAGVVAISCWLPLWLMRWTLLSTAALAIGWLCTGGAWHHDYWNLYPSDEIGRMVREEIRPICVEGIAVTSPRWVPAPTPTAMRIIPKGESSEVYLWLTAVRDRDQWRPASGWALMDVDGNLTGVRAGDHLRVMALGSQPLGPLNPGEFNYAQYERTRRIGCRLRGLFPESVTRLSRGSAWSPRLWLGSIRNRGNLLLRQHLDPNRATLAAAVLIGAREQLDPERNEGFLVTGTIHVLSISGLHVGILAAAFWFIFRTGVLPRRPTLVAAMLLTIAYACLTDLQPPVVRATILIVAMCLARLLGRQALGFNTLALAGLVVLAFNPASLFLAGPQLSFLAVAAMIVFQPLLTSQPIVDPLDRLIAHTRAWPLRWGRRVRDEIWRVWLTGAVIWAVSLPLVWQQYNLVSPVALVLNLLMWIPISLALYAGFGVLLLGAALPPLAAPCAWLCDASLGFTEHCINLGRHWPAAYWWLPSPPWWWMIVFYVVIGVYTVLPRWRLPRRWTLALASLWIVGALGLSSASVRDAIQSEPEPLACHFVSVGHGVGIVVELPDGRTLLYDTGKLGSPLGAARPVSAVLWSRGITHLDAIVISHADADHFSGIPELLDRFSVGVIYVSPYMLERKQPAVDELMQAITVHRVPLREVQAGDTLQTSDSLPGSASSYLAPLGRGAVSEGTPGTKLQMRILHPGRDAAINNDNANSIVLAIEYAGRRMLLTGDLESQGLKDLLANEAVDCDIVLAPHHGSPRSQPAGFADWSTPEYVVISGARNVEDIPAIERVKNSFRLRGAEVFHTAEDGCVTFRITTGGEIEVTTFRPHVRATPQSVDQNSPASE